MLATTSKNNQKNLSKLIDSYPEIINYLNSLTPYEYSQAAIKRTKKMDIALGNISTHFDTILVGGSNGKSTTIHFASQLLMEEKYKIGAIYANHILNYNERITINNVPITNKQLTESLKKIIQLSWSQNLNLTSYELLLLAGLWVLKQENVDVGLIEVNIGGKYDAAAICKPKIAAVTKVAVDHPEILGEELDKLAFEMMEITKPGHWFISAEQSKLRLQKMKNWIETHGSKWAMPTRKQAPLPYPYEQLYGKNASLAERIVQIYVNNIKNKFSPFLRGNLLATQEGQRGRPTLEAKKLAEKKPIKTLKKFWQTEAQILKGRFQLFDKETPQILIDPVENIEAISNFLLGLRLLHYQKPFSDIVIILELAQQINIEELNKQLRYLFKKIPGKLLLVSYINEEKQKNIYNQLSTISKHTQNLLKIHNSLEKALEVAKQTVKQRNDLIAIGGSSKFISTYFKIRGRKKL